MMLRKSVLGLGALLLAAASLLLAAPASAQLVPLRPSEGEQTCFPNHPGAWKPEGQNNDARSFGLTVAQGQALLAKVHTFTAAIRAAAVLNPPLGINAIAWEDMCCSDECRRNRTCTTLPAFGRIWLRLHYFVGQRNGTPFTDSESYADLQIWFNNPYRVFSSDPVITFPDGRKAGREPTRWREIDGLTWYAGPDDHGTRWAFLSSSDRPLWIPVTREQFLTQVIREREAEYLKEEPGDTFALAREGRAMTVKLLIQPLRDQLAGMSPAERAGQAWYSGRNPMAPLEPPNAEGARPLVVLDPAWVDRTRPRTDLQLAVMAIDIAWGKEPEAVAQGLSGGRIENASDLGNVRLWQLVNQLHWQQLAALVK